MVDLSISKARARFSEVVRQAAAGETITISRSGRPVAKVVGLQKPRLPVNAAALKALTDSMELQAQSAGEFVREMRDSDRY